MMMKKIFGPAVVLFLSIFLALAPIKSSVAAETGPLYVGVLGGHTFGSDLEYDETSYPSYDLDIQDTWMLGAKVGYTMPFAKFFAVEFEYLYFGPDVDRTILRSSGSDFTAIGGDLKAHNFMFNFIAKYPKGRIHPFVGGGFGFSYVDFSGTKEERNAGHTSTYSISGDDTAFAMQIFTGVNFEINKNFSIDLTYRYFITSSLDYEDDDYDDHHHHDHYYDNGIEVKSSMVTIGLNYHF